jgi:hypothetical protein
VIDGLIREDYLELGYDNFRLAPAFILGVTGSVLFLVGAGIVGMILLTGYLTLFTYRIKAVTINSPD